jgi:predicted acetyltransferase
MNVNLLIDAIVRQTTILIAHLATSGGTRSPLAHMANQIFVDLVRELKEQGVGNKVIADMFGLSLRTYHNRVRRMSESSTERGRTL